MQNALDSTQEIDPESKIIMMNFLRQGHTAYFLVAGNELKNQSQQLQCKHATSKQTTV
ncbi:Two-on-two hemoglobin-3 [Linum grandiflorum]